MERRPRSPDYPFISLRKALEQTACLQKSGVRWMSVREIAEAWEIGEHSSAIPQTISALKQYELVDIEGRGPERRLSLSQRARDLLSSRRDDDFDPDLLHEAVLKPDAFKKIWSFVEGGTAEHHELIRKLTHDKMHPFNPRAAEEVVRLFAESARFAGLPVALKRDTSYRPSPKGADFFAEEVLALGKIRIQYRSQPDQSDYKLLRDYFDSKLKSD